MLTFEYLPKIKDADRILFYGMWVCARHFLGLSVLLISHDLGVVRPVADHILVLRNGRIVESATPSEIFTKAQHPYTRTLLSAAPRIIMGDGRFGLSTFAMPKTAKQDQTYWYDFSDPYGQTHFVAYSK